MLQIEQNKNLFFIQNMETNKKTYTWNDISYRQFKLLKNALEAEDDFDKTIAIAQVIYGDSVIDLPINEFNQLCSKLSFLSTEVPHNITVKDITVNGRKYYFDGMLGKISTAQYIDFQNYLKANDEAKVFSVFMIPKGHKYNDGYDMLEVFEDIQDMPIPILTSASFFFNRQLTVFIKIFQYYLKKDLKKQKLPKNLKNSLEQMITNSLSSEYYHMY